MTVQYKIVLNQNPNQRKKAENLLSLMYQSTKYTTFVMLFTSSTILKNTKPTLARLNEQLKTEMHWNQCNELLKTILGKKVLDGKKMQNNRYILIENSASNYLYSKN